MKKNIIDIQTRKPASKNPQNNYQSDEFNPLDAARDTAMVNTILGKPQTVAEAYKNIMEYDVNKDLAPSK